LRSPMSPPRSADFPTRAVAVLTALAGALVAALVFAPSLLAALGRDSGLADRHNLAGDSRGAFLGYWRAGKEAYSPGLQRVADYWLRYNVAKAVIASLLLIVLVALGLLVWKAFLADSPGMVRRAALASAGVFVAGLALFVLWTEVASIQGAAAPFAALLPVMAAGAAPRSGALADAVGQIRQQLTSSAGGSEHARPALDGIVDDYVRFHVVHVIAAAPIALIFMGAGVVLWTRARKASPDRRTRRVLRSFAVSSALLSLFFIVVLAANVSTIANPDPGLLAFFSGSW
jgi:hypothetical protein